MNKPVFITYSNPRERGYKPCWTAKTGNLITTSEVSEGVCRSKHVRRLERLEMKRINREERSFLF